MGVADSTIQTLDVEHAAMATDLATARGAMSRLKSSAARADADVALAAMARLQESTVTHFDHEEAEIEDELTQRAHHPAMKEMGRQFSRRSGPAKSGTFFAWMQDGATPDEKSALRAHVPAAVLVLLGGLFGRRSQGSGECLDKAGLAVSRGRLGCPTRRTPQPAPTRGRRDRRPLPGAR